MDLSRSHIEKDSANLQEEMQQVKEAIDQQTTDHVQERERAAEQRALVDAEIEELQRSLEKKLEQRKVLTEVVDSCDIRVACIRSKFEKQLGRLEGKQRRLEEAEREVAQDTAQVEQMAAELERDREACLDAVVQRKRQIADVRRESRRLRRLRRFLSRTARARLLWQRLLEPHRASLAEVRERWERATREVAELSARSAAQEAEAAKLRCQIDAIGQALPALEAEKKLAVASRSFKEAGRLTEDIRRREDDRKAFEAQLESLQGALASAREALAACRQAEEGSQAELLGAEERCAKEELRVLRRQVNDLEALRGSAELRDSDRRLLEQEVGVLQLSREHLSSKYGISLDSLSEISEEDLAACQDADRNGEDSASEADEPTDEEDADARGFCESAPAAAVSAALAPAAAAAAAAPAPPPAEEPEVNVAVALPPPPAEPAETAPRVRPARLAEEVLQRRTVIAALVEECQAREQAIDAEIEVAVEANDFDRAEDLEETRKQVALKAEAARYELLALDAELEALGAPPEDAAAVAAASPAEAEDRGVHEAVEEADVSLQANHATAPAVAAPGDVEGGAPESVVEADGDAAVAPAEVEQAAPEALAEALEWNGAVAEPEAAPPPAALPEAAVAEALAETEEEALPQVAQTDEAEVAAPAAPPPPPPPPADGGAGEDEGVASGVLPPEAANAVAGEDAAEVAEKLETY